MKQKGIATIIFCNNSAELIMIGNEAATQNKLKELRAANKYEHVNKWRDMDTETYDRRFIWHIKYADYEVIK